VVFRLQHDSWTPCIDFPFQHPDVSSSFHRNNAFEVGFSAAAVTCRCVDQKGGIIRQEKINSPSAVFDAHIPLEAIASRKLDVAVFVRHLAAAAKVVHDDVLAGGDDIYGTGYGIHTDTAPFPSDLQETFQAL